MRERLYVHKLLFSCPFFYKMKIKNMFEPRNDFSQKTNVSVFIHLPNGIAIITYVLIKFTWNICIPMVLDFPIMNFIFTRKRKIYELWLTKNFVIFLFDLEMFLAIVCNFIKRDRFVSVFFFKFIIVYVDLG